MTPEMYSPNPGVVKSISRYARRLSSVEGTAILVNRFSIVPVLSSAARIPFPGATICFAISASDIGVILHEMFGLDKANRARIRGHHHGVRHYLVCGEEHSVGKRARNDAGCGEANVISLRKVARLENGREISNARVIEALDMFFILRFSSAEPLPSQATHRCGGKHRFGAAADTHQDINT